MDLTSLFSDDQLAVMGCFIALAVCGGIAALSFQFGPAKQRPATRSVQFRDVRRDDRHDDSTRKAA
ncbi:MAG: hypothetical protein R3C19_05025 [Planctomycetaceae bacterium]